MYICEKAAVQGRGSLRAGKQSCRPACASAYTRSHSICVGAAWGERSVTWGQDEDCRRQCPGSGSCRRVCCCCCCCLGCAGWRLGCRGEVLVRAKWCPARCRGRCLPEAHQRGRGYVQSALAQARGDRGATRRAAAAAGGAGVTDGSPGRVFERCWWRLRPPPTCCGAAGGQPAGQDRA